MAKSRFEYVFDICGQGKIGCEIIKDFFLGCAPLCFINQPGVFEGQGSLRGNRIHKFLLFRSEGLFSISNVIEPMT